MFGRWFQRELPAEDRVWLDGPACRRGLQRDVLAARADAAVLVLLRSRVDLADLASALAQPGLQVATDPYAAQDLRTHLRQPGALGLADVGDLRPMAASDARVPLEIHVLGRAPRRSEDTRLLELLKPFAPRRVMFHHALDDALLREHAGRLKPLMQRLGLEADEPITSPMLAQAIKRVQRP